MDAFFASVEQRDNPDLKGKPVAVGGNKDRGVVAAASYEARKFGVFSAMSSRLAARKCPHLIFVPPRFDAYKRVSETIQEIFFEYTDLVEPLSLDEAFLDVTHNKKSIPSATMIARDIKESIIQATGLTASAGISVNKFLAKTASDVKKPNGLFLISPDEVLPFISRMPIERFYGIGKVTAEKMKKMGILFGEDLRHYSEIDLTTRFGKSGHFYYNICRGIDDRPVNPERIRKSIGAENTFSKDIVRYADMIRELEKLAGELVRRMHNGATRGRTFTIKIKYFDFQQITRSRTGNEWIETLPQLKVLIQEICEEIIPEEKGIRLLGVSLSNLENDDESKKPVQLTLKF